MLAIAQMMGWRPADFWAANYYEFSAALAGMARQSGLAKDDEQARYTADNIGDLQTALAAMAQPACKGE